MNFYRDIRTISSIGYILFIYNQKLHSTPPFLPLTFYYHRSTLTACIAYTNYIELLILMR